MYGLVVNATAPIVKSFQERPRLLSTQIKLSSIRSDLKK